MNIRPLYDRVVVKRIEKQETTLNGIIIPDSAKEKPQEGEVIAVGNGKRLEDGTLVALGVKAGDDLQEQRDVLGAPGQRAAMIHRERIREDTAPADPAVGRL